MRQFMREKEYGVEDMYSVEDALLCAGLSIMDTYFDEKSEKEARIKIKEIQDALKDEMNISETYWNENRYFSERKAKELADYREAYRYHCTYAYIDKEGLKHSKEDIVHNYYKDHEE